MLRSIRVKFTWPEWNKNRSKESRGFQKSQRKTTGLLSSDSSWNSAKTQHRLSVVVQQPPSSNIHATWKMECWKHIKMFHCAPCSCLIWFVCHFFVAQWNIFSYTLLTFLHLYRHNFPLCHVIAIRGMLLMSFWYLGKKTKWFDKVLAFILNISYTSGINHQVYKA